MNEEERTEVVRKQVGYVISLEAIARIDAAARELGVSKSVVVDDLIMGRMVVK